MKLKLYSILEYYCQWCYEGVTLFWGVSAQHSVFRRAPMQCFFRKWQILTIEKESIPIEKSLLYGMNYAHACKIQIHYKGWVPL